MTDYYNKPALSYSGIKRYLTDGPHSFWRTSVFNPMRIKEEPTLQMIKGKAAHTLLLEPAKFPGQFAVKNKVDGRTKEGKAYNEEFLATVVNRDVIDDVTRDELILMTGLLKTNSDFKVVTGNRENWMVEEEFFWEYDGIQKKAKMDLIVNQGGNPVILDYKTCQNCDPSHFQRDIVNQKYYLQAAFYIEAFIIKYNATPKFVFVAQEIDFPENAAMYELAPADLAVGNRELIKATAEIKARLASGNWKPYNGGIQQLDLPTWFYTRQQENENDGI